MAFDPYHKWLGIRPEQGPPTHYQVLGISPDEKDPEIIEEAAIRQSAHVRGYQIGPHGAEATRLLNAISQARTILLHPLKRKEYDATLARKENEKLAVTAKSAATASSGVPDFTAELDGPELVSVKKRPQTKSASAGSKKGLIYLAGGGGAAAVFAVVLIVVLSSGKPEHQPAPNPNTDLAKAKEKQNPKKIQDKNTDKETAVKIDHDKKTDKQKVDDGKQEVVVKAGDKELAKKFVGNYLLKHSGPTGSGETHWRFTPEKNSVQGNNNVGTWQVENGTIVVTYLPPWEGYGQAVLRFTDDNSLVGENVHKNGQKFKWVLEREGSVKAKPPDPIVIGPEASGPSPLDKLDPAKIAAEDRLEKIPELVAVLKGSKREVFAVAFSPDSKKVACTGNDGQVYLWDVTGPEPGPAVLVGDAGRAMSGLAFSPNSSHLAFANDAKTCVYDISGPKPVQKLQVDLKVAHFASIAYAPDAKTLAVTDNTGVRLLDLSADQAKERSMVGGRARGLRTVYFNRDGSRMLTAGFDGMARVWNMKTEPPEEQCSCKTTSLWHAVFSPDGQSVAGGDNNCQVHVWDIKGANMDLRWSKREHSQWTNSVCFAPDGKTLISTEGGGSPRGPHYLIWWNAANGDVIKKWDLPERCSQGVFAPTGMYVALTSHNHKVFILRLKAAE